MSPLPAAGPSTRSYTLVEVIAVLAAMAIVGAAAYNLTQRALAPDAQSDAAVSDAVQQALRLRKPVVAEFGANSCENCREMKLVLGALARVHGDRITVVDIDLRKTTGYAARYQIQLMPTQVFFDAQGREIGRHMGKISGDEILAKLNLPPNGSAP